MMKKILLTMLLLAASSIAFVSCKSDDNTTTPTYSSAKVYDFSADTVGYGTHYALFSFSDTARVSLEDSATTKWDVGFMMTRIILNSGLRGPGGVEVAILSNTSFTDVKQAPTTGFVADTSLTAMAIPYGSGKGWYTYNGETHLVSPIAGKIFVFKIGNGKYVKMRIMNYYKGHPATPNPETDQSKYYSFEYQISDASGKFE